MIGLCYVLASATIGAMALAAYLAVMAFGARALGDAAQKRADALQVELDAHKLEDANVATKTAADAEKAQERRGDSLEKDLTDAEKAPADPASALAQLSALSGPGPGAGTGSPKR